MDRIYTCANSCADFIAGSSRRKGRRLSAFLVGERAVVEAVESVADRVPMTSAENGSELIVPEGHPDFVVIGSCLSEQTREIEVALEFVRRGSKLLHTCPDLYEMDSSGYMRLGGPIPTVDLICKRTGSFSYNVGKPNTMMARHALSKLGDDAAVRPIMVGDSMGTDIRMSVEFGMDCVLVLSGCTAAHTLSRHPLEPTFLYATVADLVKDLDKYV